MQHAIAYVEGDKYYGAKATINVWEPKIQQANEFSLSQLWILGGSFGEDLNSIEAGWQVVYEFSLFIDVSSKCWQYLSFMWCLVHQVSPDLYGDNNTRLFTYWTVSLTSSVSLAHIIINVFLYLSSRHYSAIEASTHWLALLCYCLFCRVMHTRRQGATTYCALVSFRLTARSPWGLAFSPSRTMQAPNMISASWSGRLAFSN